MFALLKELVCWAGILLPLWFQTVVEKGEKRIRGRRPKKHMCVLLPLGSHRAQLVPTASHTSRPLSSLSLSSSVRVQKFQTALREKPTTVPGLKDNTQRGKMENAGICSSSCCSVRGEPRLVGLLTPRRRGAVKWRAVGYREPVRPPTDFLFFFLFFFSSGSGPPSLSGRAELCSEASQPFKVNSSPGDVLLSKGWGEGREGARSKLPLKWV